MTAQDKKEGGLRSGEEGAKIEELSPLPAHITQQLTPGACLKHI